MIAPRERKNVHYRDDLSVGRGGMGRKPLRGERGGDGREEERGEMGSGCEEREGARGGSRRKGWGGERIGRRGARKGKEGGKGGREGWEAGRRGREEGAFDVGLPVRSQDRDWQRLMESGLDKESFLAREEVPHSPCEEERRRVGLG